ncbi:TRAP transporter small permease subunit [Rhodovibrionaceae bacterium A322]
MQALLSLSAVIDRALGVLAKIGAWAGVFLMVAVCYDVITRYFGVPKPFGMNSTQFQETEYWAHTVLFSLVIGYAYVKQSHVRIDLVRDRLPLKAKYWIEFIGCLVALLPFCLIAIYFTYGYAHTSFIEGEVSKSVIGLTNIWILKAFICVMFILLTFAGISQMIKALAGLTGNLPDSQVTETIGGDH